MLKTSKEKTEWRATPEFQEIRERHLSEGKYCRLCGRRTNALNLHHIDELKYGEPDEYDWTILLCRACHLFIERKSIVLHNKKNITTPLSLELKALIDKLVVHD